MHGLIQMCSSAQEEERKGQGSALGHEVMGWCWV